MTGFWGKLPKPFFVMAPMADVTDCVFRQIIAECCVGSDGRRQGPDVFFTEFVAADGLAHPVARERLLIDWKYGEYERPIVAQMFGSRPENIRVAAALARDLGLDGIDINMGCPEANVCKQGAGANLIQNPDLAKQVIEAAKEGAGDLPVSVKTRMGYSSVSEFDSWFQTLLECDLAAITIHLRTKKEMSKVPAHWELAGEMRRLGGETAKLIANGDVRDLADAQAKASEHDLDGVMLGRAIFGNPWLFAGKSKEDVPWPERLRVMQRHADLYQETFIDAPMREGRKPYKGFAIMRKFFGAYVSGHPEASEFKVALMLCENAQQVREVVSKFGI